MFKDEAALCSEFVRQFADLVLYNQIYFPDSLIWFHIPNGQRAGGWALTNAIIDAFPFLEEHRAKVFELINRYGAIAGNRDKRLGARKGTPDYFFSFRNKDGVPYIGFLEAKHGKGVLSPEQKAFQRHCKAEGVFYGVFRTLDEAFRILRIWGMLKESCIYG